MVDTATFAVALEDQTSGPAEDAAKALSDLKGQIDADVKALRAMQRAQRQLKGSTVINVQAFKELRDKIAAQKATVATAQARFVNMGGTFDAVKPKAQQLAGAADDLGSQLQGLPGPLGAAAGGFSKLRQLLVGGGLAGGMLAIAAAAVAMVAALGAATVALLRYGIAQSNARRSELLRLEGLTTIRRFQGLAAGSADNMQAAIDRVSDATTLGRPALERWTSQLHRMGLRGEDLSQALEGVAITADVQGERFARRFAGMAAAAARTGGSVRALADDVRARLGGIALRRLLDWDVQVERLRRNFDRLTGGLRLEGMLMKLLELTNLLSQSTASGRALKTIFEAAFQPLVDLLERALPLGRRFFQGMILAALQFATAIVRVRNFLVSTFGAPDLLGNIDGVSAAVTAGKIVFFALAAAVGLAVVVVGALALAFAALAAPVLLAVGAVSGIVSAIRSAVDFIRGIDWAALGRGIIEGITSGVRSGISGVTGAMRSIASSAQSVFAGDLEIRSPSGIFRRLAVEVPHGMVAGIEDGAPAVDAAVAGLVTPPNIPTGGTTTAAPGSQLSISIGDIIIQSATEEPRALAEAFRDELASVLEGVAITMGAANA